MTEQVKDVYTWQVTYADGAITKEYDETRPDGRGWAEREAKDVAAITLARVDGTEGRMILIPEGAEPVFFRRRSITFAPSTDEQQARPTIHCIGWKTEKNAQYLFVYNDGTTLLTDDLQAV